MDFFICHNEADKQWAGWISWQLVEAGYKVWNPDWHISAGENEIIAINRVLADADAQKTMRRMILILSPNFGGNSYQEVSRTFIQALDPDGSKGLLIPIKISDKVNENIISSAVKTIDLYLYSDERQALDCLLSGISKQRGKSLKIPFFPGQSQKSQTGKPFFPAISVNHRLLQKLQHLIEKNLFIRYINWVNSTGNRSVIICTGIYRLLRQVIFLMVLSFTEHRKNGRKGYSINWPILWGFLKSN